MKLSLMLALFGVLLSALGALAEPEAQRPPRIAMEDFFRTPDRTGYALSPDGTHYAWLQPWEGRLNIHVAAVDGSGVRRVTAATERDIRAYGWIADDRLVYLQDSGGDENYHLYALSYRGGDVVDLTPYDGVRAGIVDLLEEDPDHLLVSLNLRDRRVFDVYRLNVHTGEKELAAENPGTVVGWGTDNQGRIRIAYAIEGVKNQVLYRDSEEETFRMIFETDFRDSVSPVGFTADDQRLYLISDLGRDLAALYEYDPATGDQTLLYQRDDAGISDIIWSKHRKKLLAAAYYTDKPGRHYFDQEFQDFVEKLKSHFPGLLVGVSSMSRDEERMIVSVRSDRVPGRLYYYDKANPDEYRELTDLYPWLKEEYLAPMEPLSYSSRDGLTIHGYLTLPLGLEPKNLPTVVVVHGGPEARDYWGYDSEVQFLANRGLAVLQVNYRVSTGYGKAFWEAGFRQWGLKQQDDITDGVQWLIDQGIADPDRIAIYGGSYGGYATLMGLIKTPELYAAGIDYVGVSNLFALFDSIPPYWEPLRETMYETIGHPERDAQQFRDTSPVYHAEKIQAPLLIAQGANDPRVVKAQSDEMVQAMRDRGVEVEYMVKDNEGHGFSNEENRFDFYRAMESFLIRHLALGEE